MEKERNELGSNGLLVELSGIINKSLRRGFDENAECRWLLELPMTDAEHKRFKEIISTNASLTLALSLRERDKKYGQAKI
jgi:hypothetical protein